MDRPLAGIVEPPAAVTPAAAPRVIVSNHGGRQLDGGMAMLDALPAVARAVGNRVTVMMDGGVRRGAHMVKALAMGAKAVLVGRATLYGSPRPASRARCGRSRSCATSSPAPCSCAACARWARSGRT